MKNNIFLYKNWNLLFYIIALTTLFSTKEINIYKISLIKFNIKYLFLFLVIILLPVLTVVVLDALLVKTGMAETNLFVGAELRKPTNISELDFLIEGFLSPIASQIFITGYILNVLTKKKDLVAIPGNGIIYTLINFDFGLGYLGLGMISAGLVRLTGTLLPAIAFSTGCSLSKILILTTYPRVATVLVFLI